LTCVCNISSSSATLVQPSAVTSPTGRAVTRDQQRRRCNIIISGFPESEQISYADSLRELCECHLNYKPWLDDSRCQRLGKSSPRLLRVTLASEQGAAELLFAAKTRLSKSDDSALCRIYFNRDLNPAEAKQAYLLRKERREGRQSAVNSAGILILWRSLFQPHRKAQLNQHDRCDVITFKKQLRRYMTNVRIVSLTR